MITASEMKSLAKYLFSSFFILFLQLLESRHVKASSSQAHPHLQCKTAARCLADLALGYC
jgi:hypothetical protein